MPTTAAFALNALRSETAIAYDERMKGTLQLFRTQAQVYASGKDVRALAADGIPLEVLDRDGCIRVEPALSHVPDKFVGGLSTPMDENRRLLQVHRGAGAKVATAWSRFLWGQTSGA